VTEPTPSIVDAARELLAERPGPEVLTGLHGLLQANLLSAMLSAIGQGPYSPPDPETLRVEAADLRLCAGALAEFLDRLAGAIEASSN
jgi:hypothetical protein